MSRRRPDTYEPFPPGRLRDEMEAREAEAQRWDQAAQVCANTFWFWAIIAGLVWWAWRWWALIPAVFALLRAMNTIGAALIAKRLREPPVFTEEAEVIEGDTESGERTLQIEESD